MRTSPAGVAIAPPSRLDRHHRVVEVGERRGLASEHTLRRVAATDAADRPVAEHVVERCEHGRGDSRIARGGVRYERADHDALGRGEDLRVDDVGLLPKDVRVERPDAGESELLGPRGKLDDAAGRRVRLQRDGEVHGDTSPKLIASRLPGAGTATKA
jgi:hypothetical protein